MTTVEKRQSRPDADDADEPFLCLQRKTSNDARKHLALMRCQIRDSNTTHKYFTVNRLV